MTLSQGLQARGHQSTVFVVQWRCHTPHPHPRVRTALAQRGRGSSQSCFGEHPCTPSPSGSVWKGGVKKGRFLKLLQTAVYSDTLLLHQMTDTIRRSQREDPGIFMMTGAQIKQLSPAALPGKLWEQDPKHPVSLEDKYLKPSFHSSQTLPSPHAL